MIVYGHGSGAGFKVASAALVSYSAPLAAIVMADVNPLGPFIYTVPDVV